MLTIISFQFLQFSQYIKIKYTLKKKKKSIINVIMFKFTMFIRCHNYNLMFLLIIWIFSMKLDADKQAILDPQVRYSNVSAICS